jgi:hypothetical protein
MNRAAADRLTAIIVAELDGILSVADPLIGPEELCLMRFVGSKLLKGPPPGARVERDNLESLLGETTSERASPRSRSHDRKVHFFVLRILSHRNPPAEMEYVGSAAILATRVMLRIIEHAGSP